MLPEGEDLNEWVAVNTVDFFNQVSFYFSGDFSRLAFETDFDEFDAWGLGYWLCILRILDQSHLNVSLNTSLVLKSLQAWF